MAHEEPYELDFVGRYSFNKLVKLDLLINNRIRFVLFLSLVQYMAIENYALQSWLYLIKRNPNNTIFLVSNKTVQSICNGSKTFRRDTNEIHIELCYFFYYYSFVIEA